MENPIEKMKHFEFLSAYAAATVDALSLSLSPATPRHFFKILDLNNKKLICDVAKQCILIGTNGG